MSRRIKNWSEFQHYKDRCPPWIKLYRSLLEDINFLTLCGDSELGILIRLWLIASEDKEGKGQLPDSNTLAVRLHMAIPGRVTKRDIAKVEKKLSALQHWMEHDDSTMLQPSEHVAILETERETERETYLDTGENTRIVPVEDASTQEEFPTPSQPTDLTSENGEKPTSKSGLVWKAYSEAYRVRYGVIPTRNGKISKQLCTLVDYAGAELAPKIAAHYLTNNSQWYVTKGHSVDYLLSDWQKLRTEYLTGTQVTQTQAREGDRLQGQGDAWQRVIERRGEQQ